MNNRTEKILFWGCFIALITTSYAFFSRMYLCGGRFMLDFNLDRVAAGELAGAGIWPFGVSIVLFSLIIDKVGYKVTMYFSFACYLIYSLLAFMAYGAIQGLEGAALIEGQQRGYSLLYAGSIILGLGNGAVEAFINPIVVAMFKDQKTKWLNILHAGWPLGLVFGGLVTISLASHAAVGDWRIVIGFILVPAFIFFAMLVPFKFPRSEREQAGVSYLEMLKELGGFGALVAFGLVFAQLGQVWDWPNWVVWMLTILVVAVFLVLTRSFGRGIMAILIIIMMPLATTELGTDGWISSLMERPMSAAGFNAGWVLVYTSTIMVILRFSAGSIVHRLSPLGLLAASSALACAGLLLLSQTGNAGVIAIFAAATVYGIGKTFFWPTMLGVAAEQCPKGGALTLNTLAGIGMLAVGIIGVPFIGYLQESTATSILRSEDGEVYEQVHIQKEYLLGRYDAIDPLKSEGIIDPAKRLSISEANKAGQFSALGKMAVFPAFMFVCYIGLILYFRSRGGYKVVILETRGEGNP